MRKILTIQQKHARMVKKDFADKDILMNNQYFKRYLTSFIITEIQTQTIIKKTILYS